MNIPKISVLMPVYNTKEEYLREAIESILNQTYSNFEFIIFNDGSTNNAKEVILSYNDSRIQYFEHENQGVAKTTNKMFDIAKGEYIALMDSDDIANQKRLEIEINFLINNPDIEIVSACYDSIPSGFGYYSEKKEVKYFDLIKCNQIPNICSMFHKKLIKDFNLRYDESFICAHDYDFWSKALKYLRCVILPDKLCQYRVLGNSISHSDNNLLNKEENTVHQNMIKFLTENNIYKEKILEILNDTEKYSPLDKILSIEKNNKYKVLKLFGIKFKKRI